MPTAFGNASLPLLWKRNPTFVVCDRYCKFRVTSRPVCHLQPITSWRLVEQHGSITSWTSWNDCNNKGLTEVKTEAESTNVSSGLGRRSRTRTHLSLRLLCPSHILLQGFQSLLQIVHLFFPLPELARQLLLRGTDFRESAEKEMKWEWSEDEMKMR